MALRILILGGTLEARHLAGMLANRAELDVTVSLAGRTASPVPHSVPVRVGGFGGAEGLAGYIVGERVSMVIDATHPYAGAISRNAALASGMTGVPILALRRPPWTREAADRWEEVASVEQVRVRLGAGQRRVFLAIGRQQLGAFEAAPQHRYLIRTVDPVDPPLRVPHARYRVERGPFDQAGERAMLRDHDIDVVVAKNSGGAATYGKLAAARELGVEVLLLARPALPTVPEVACPEAAVRWLDHVFALRGV